MRIAEFVKEKTVEEFIAYAKQVEDKKFRNKAEITSAVSKLVDMAKAYGFKHYRSFNYMCHPPVKGENTSDFYHLKVGEFGYIQLHIGFIYESQYETKRVQNKWKRWVTKEVRKPTTAETPVKGVFRVEDHSKPSLNPSTGRPWAVGDIDYSREDRPMLTERGWWTGD